eukprot:jgi/Mesvir1/390/Mv11282-RA.1
MPKVQPRQGPWAFPPIVAVSKWISRAQQAMSDIIGLYKGEGSAAEAQRFMDALHARDMPTVLQFYSKSCKLCKSMRSDVASTRQTLVDRVGMVMVDVDDVRWMPETLHYGMEYVPCFVLLDRDGNALSRTPPPATKKQMLQNLDEIVQHALTLPSYIDTLPRPLEPLPPPPDLMVDDPNRPSLAGRG